MEAVNLQNGLAWGESTLDIDTELHKWAAVIRCIIYSRSCKLGRLECKRLVETGKYHLSKLSKPLKCEGFDDTVESLNYYYPEILIKCKKESK